MRGSAIFVHLAFALAAALAAQGAPEGGPLARGDAAWEERHAGARGSRAAPGPIGEAVKAYEEAYAADPEDLEICWKLLRALQFQGAHTTDDRDEKQAVFGRGREVADRTLDLLAERVGGRKTLDKMQPEEFRDKFPEPEVARIYFWATANWGEWGRAYGKLAAARQGVASRVRDYSRIVIALDPEYEDGGGYRIHGRLHAEAPKIPFVTGWIDRKVAVRDGRLAYEINPDLPYNRLYLADAWLKFDKGKKQEGLRILRELVASEPRPEQAVVDSQALEEARALLEEYE